MENVGGPWPFEKHCVAPLFGWTKIQTREGEKLAVMLLKPLDEAGRERRPHEKDKDVSKYP